MSTNQYGIVRMIELLQQEHAKVDGVETAPLFLEDYPMGQIERMDMPAVLTFPSEGQWDMWNMHSQDTQRRTFDVKLIVADHETGLDGESLQNVAILMQRLGQLYTQVGKQQLQSTPSQILINVNDFPATDTGLTALVAWDDVLYWGCEFQVQLTEKYTSGVSS